MFLESITPSLISRQGTDIGAAINLAMKSFTPNEEVGKAIIVITDGENHEGGAEEAAKAAAEKGMTIYMMGIGTTDGAPIPTGKLNEFRKDKEGNVVMTKLNEQMGQQIAKAGGGAYIRVDNTNNAQKLLLKELDKLSKDEVTTDVYSEYDDQFEFIAWIVLFLLTLDILLLPGKSRFTRNIKLFDERK